MTPTVVIGLTKTEPENKAESVKSLVSGVIDSLKQDIKDMVNVNTLILQVLITSILITS
jgi:hypothetical protein